MNSRVRAKQYRHRGAAAVEAALVLSAATLLLFGSLDASLAVLRRNLLENAVCRAARAAAVLGKRSPNPLGPTSWNGTAASSHPIADAIRPMLSTMSPSTVTISATWPDGANDEDDRVTVQLSTQIPSVFATLFGSVWTLHASSTTAIAH